MKTAIWLVSALLAMVWTGGAALSAELLEWAGNLMASGQAADWGRQATALPIPAWLAVWIDPALFRAMQETVLGALELVQGFLPATGTALTWLVPVVWVAWAIGIALLAMLAVGAQWLLRRGVPRLAVPA